MTTHPTAWIIEAKRGGVSLLMDFEKDRLLASGSIGAVRAAARLLTEEHGQTGGMPTDRIDGCGIFFVGATGATVCAFCRRRH